MSLPQAVSAAPQGKCAFIMVPRTNAWPKTKLNVCFPKPRQAAQGGVEALNRRLLNGSIEAIAAVAFVAVKVRRGSILACQSPSHLTSLVR